MGGAQAGEVASKAAAESFDRELPPAPPERVLRETIETANRRSTARPTRTPTWPGWGRRSPPRSSTPEAEEVAIGHVGDSRAYRLRGGKLERLTRDHSLVEEMRRKGQLTEAQAEDHPQRSIITRALGPGTGGRGRRPDRPRPGRRRLPALLRRADDDARRRADRAAARPRHLDAVAVRALVDEANRAGGRDNITVVAFRLEDAAAPAGDAGVGAQAGAEGATLIGASAEEAGLTATEVRRRAAAEAARKRREEQATKPRRRGLQRAAKVRGAAGRARGDRLRRLVRQPPGLVPRHRRRRPGRPLPRPALRAAVRAQALRRALREPDPDRVAAAEAARRRYRPRPALDARTRST